MAVAIAVIILLACLGLAFLPLVFTPGVVEAAGRASADRRAALEWTRDRALEAIREVDMDHAMGKLGTRDHAALRATNESQALAALAALKALDSEEAQSESVKTT